MTKFDMFLMDWRNALAFGWWMNDQQTEDEIEKGATIEKNNRGWDKPDGYRFTLWLEALRRMDDISMEEVDEAVDELRSSLEKYFRQWQEFYGDPYWTRNLPAWTKELPQKRQKQSRIVVMRNLDDDLYVKAVNGGYVELTGNRKEAVYLREDEASKIVDGSDRLWLQFTSGPDAREDRKRAKKEREKAKELARQEAKKITRIDTTIDHVPEGMCILMRFGKYVARMDRACPIFTNNKTNAMILSIEEAYSIAEAHRRWRGLEYHQLEIIKR